MQLARLRSDPPAVRDFDAAFDAYSPAEVALRISEFGVGKARLQFTPMCSLGVLGGAFIALGALFYALITSDAGLSFAVGRLTGGLVFSLGLILVIVAGAELFTGNVLLVMAWADQKVSSLEVLTDWVIIYIANAIGAVMIALIAYWAGLGELNDQAIARHVLSIAQAKASMPFWRAFCAGVLCNVLVCLAIWLAMAGRSVADKVVAIVFPISAFVAAGFEHSVANFFFFALAGIYCMVGPNELTAALPDNFVFQALAGNLLPVTLGNIVGGAVLVGLVYHLIYRDRSLPQPDCAEPGFDDRDDARAS
jgi:formate transporter